MSSQSPFIYTIPNELVLLIASLLDRSSLFALNNVANKYAKLKGVFDPKPLTPFSEMFPGSSTNVSYILILRDITIDIIANNYIDLFKWLKPDSEMLTVAIPLIQEYCNWAAFHGSLDILKYVISYGGVGVSELYINNKLGDTHTRSKFHNDIINIGLFPLGLWPAKNVVYPYLDGRYSSYDDPILSTNPHTENNDMNSIFSPHRCHFDEFDLDPSIFVENNENDRHSIIEDYNSFATSTGFDDLQKPKAVSLDMIRADFDVRFNKPYKPYKNIRKIFIHAAAGGDLNIMKWLHTEHECPITEHAYSPAAAFGHIHVIDYLIENKCPITGSDACSDAVIGDKLDTLKYLHTKGFRLDGKYNWPTIIRNGNMEMLKYFHKHAHFPDNTARSVACSYAIRCNQFEILKYLHRIGCEWDNNTFLEATILNRLDIVKYLHEHGCPLNNSACDNAAMRGNLEMLKYLHEIGCPWSERTCSEAVEHNHFEVLKYLHKNGCPLHRFLCYAASDKGQLDILNYLLENGCPCDINNCCYYAAPKGYLDVLKCLYKYKKDDKCSCHENILLMVVEKGHLDVLKYLQTELCENTK